MKHLFKGLLCSALIAFSTGVSADNNNPRARGLFDSLSTGDVSVETSDETTNTPPVERLLKGDFPTLYDNRTAEGIPGFATQIRVQWPYLFFLVNDEWERFCNLASGYHGNAVKCHSYLNPSKYGYAHIVILSLTDDFIIYTYALTPKSSMDNTILSQRSGVSRWTN